MRFRRCGWPATGWIPTVAEPRSATHSARVRLTLVAALVTALVLVASALLLVWLFQRSLTANADDLSRIRAEDLLALAARDALPATVTTVGDDGVAQVVSADGQVVAASPNVQGQPPLTTERPGDEAQVLMIDDAPDDDETEDYRVWAVRSESSGAPVYAYVGVSRETVSESTASLVRNLVLGIPVVQAILTVLIWVLVGRTLRPVEAASARQRAFVADASHDLQTPLAAFRSHLEVGLARPDSTDWPETARALLGDSDRMERLVKDLLFLARQDEARPPPDRPVDLDDVVLEEVARLGADRRLVLDTSRVSAAPVRGSRDDLARLVRNLLHNAQRHAASRVGVQTSAHGERTLLVVEDDGPGIDPEHRAHLFERFSRVDESRDYADGGSGLGLAIVRAVAERHGGSAALDDAATGARFVVRLPSA